MFRQKCPVQGRWLALSLLRDAPCFLVFFFCAFMCMNVVKAMSVLGFFDKSSFIEKKRAKLRPQVFTSILRARWCDPAQELYVDEAGHSSTDGGGNRSCAWSGTTSSVTSSRRVSVTNDWRQMGCVATFRLTCSAWSSAMSAMVSPMVELALTLVSASGWRQAGAAWRGEEAAFRDLSCKTHTSRSFTCCIPLCK